MTPELENFCRRIGYQFADEQLLLRALRHRSCGADNNERLEFLGDGLLNLIIAESLFHRFSDVKEGQLSRLRANLVNGVTLSELATEMEFGAVLQLGEGERQSGGRQRASIRANAVEAVIGAIYLDSDFATTQQKVLTWYGSRLEEIDLAEPQKDAKTRLQEWLQARGKALPSYTLQASEGADHAQQFHIACKVAALKNAVIATGSSRKKAEQAAAQQVLELLEGSQNG
ncbi:ribonuclease III [Spongiibacter sp. KMU-158]|uniref:Ribonuclease 3 n=1 Tax=Spongiibacter pelagi TaxID=2760804 RepID=A0A927C331_9GAMM|nr:ribonuclease III [Spongiibacter pelagi]MBD2858580.1 ribonuclease III [Spongiibacter pelagi]